MTLRVDLGPEYGTQQVFVLKNDVSASQVAERVLQQARVRLQLQDYRSVSQRLAKVLEIEINQKIQEMVNQRNK